jgi:hypothetical protein
MTRVIRAFVRRRAWLIDVNIVKKGPRMVSLFCKDHHFGIPVANEVSRRTLTPGVYHRDGLYPLSLAKPPHFLLRSCRTSTGWYKRKVEASEVMGLYDVSDTLALALNQKLRSKVIGVKHLTPIKIILSPALSVIEEVPGGGGELIPDRRVKVRQEEEQDVKRFENQAGELGQLGLKGKPFLAQEE